MYTQFRTRIDVRNPPAHFAYNEYFEFRLDSEHILLTTRHKPWAILTNDEYDLFKRKRVAQCPDLFSILESLGVILSPENVKRVEKEYFQKYSYLTTPPDLFIVVPTNRCNLYCRYCHAQAGPASQRKDGDMPEDLLLKTVDFFLSVPRSTNTFRIEFQGGEPLLRFDLIQKAMDYVEKRAGSERLECSFAIVTNLTTMTDKIAAEIKDRGNVHLCSSLDGPKIVHDFHRPYFNGKGSYERVVYWIERLRDKYQIKLGLLPTCTRKTIDFEKALIDEYLKYEINRIFIRPVREIGRAYEQPTDDIGLNANEFVHLWKTVIDYCIAKCRSGEFVVEVRAKYLLENILLPGYHFMCIRKPCGCGISQLTVAPDGSIYGCDGARSIEMLKLGHVSDTTYDELITSDGARALRTLAPECLPLCESCPFGPYCGYCVARGINQHGSPVPKIPVDFECQIYREMIPYLFRKLMNREDALILNQWVDS